MWLRDTGVLGKMKDDEHAAPIPIPDPKIKVDERISVEHLGLGIAIYSAGMLLSLLFFIGELSTKKRVNRVEKKQRRPRKAALKPPSELHTKSIRVKRVEKKQQQQRKGPLYEINSNNMGKDIIIPHKMGRQAVGHR